MTRIRLPTCTVDAGSYGRPRSDAGVVPTNAAAADTSTRRQPLDRGLRQLFEEARLETVAGLPMQQVQHHDALPAIIATAEAS